MTCGGNGFTYSGVSSIGSGCDLGDHISPSTLHSLYLCFQIFLNMIAQGLMCLGGHSNKQRSSRMWILMRIDIKSYDTYVNDVNCDISSFVQIMTRYVLAAVFS